MHHANTPHAQARALAQERRQLLTRFVAPHAVQVDLRLDVPVAAAQPRHDMLRDAAAAKRQGFVRLQQGLHVELVGQRLAFTANRFEISAADGRRLLAGSYRLASGTRPHAIDLAHDERPLLTTLWRGIVAVEGDTLRYCENAVDLDAPRPTSFAPTPGSGELCITYRRDPR